MAQNLQSNHPDHLVQRKSFRSTGFHPISGLIGGAFLGGLVYPLIRLQTLAQTSSTTGSITQLAKNSGGYFKGVSPYVLFAAGSGLVTTMPFVGPLLASAFYPLEVAQIKLAASEPKSEHFNVAETVKSMQQAKAYSGVSTLIARNYLIYFGMLFAEAGSYSILLPSILGGIALDNIRRNYVANHLGEEGNSRFKFQESYNQIIKNHGLKGLFRGYLFYPAIYAIPFIAVGSTFSSKH